MLPSIPWKRLALYKMQRCNIHNTFSQLLPINTDIHWIRGRPPTMKFEFSSTISEFTLTSMYCKNYESFSLLPFLHPNHNERNALAKKETEKPLFTFSPLQNHTAPSFWTQAITVKQLLTITFVQLFLQLFIGFLHSYRFWTWNTGHSYPPTSHKTLTALNWYQRIFKLHPSEFNFARSL